MKFTLEAKQINDDGSIGWESGLMSWHDNSWLDTTFLQDVLCSGFLLTVIEAGYQAAIEGGADPAMVKKVRESVADARKDRKGDKK